MLQNKDLIRKYESNMFMIKAYITELDKRFDKLKALVESQISENNQKYVGMIQKVLVEGESKNNKELLTGRTDSNKVVIFEGNKELIGQMIELEIISEHMWYLKGKII